MFYGLKDKIREFDLKQGEAVEVSVDLESREYNGRWYTDVKAWKVSKYNAGTQSMHTNSDQSLNDTESGDGLSIGDIEKYRFRYFSYTIICFDYNYIHEVSVLSMNSFWAAHYALPL